MTSEQKQAYDWAKNQNYTSVAARYAKVLADLVDELSTRNENNPSCASADNKATSGYKNTLLKDVRLHVELTDNDIFNWLVECQNPETLRYLGRAALKFAAGLEHPDGDDFRSRA